MRLVVKCPKDGQECNKILDKTMSLHKDLLYQCPICKLIIPIRIFKVKHETWR